MDNKAIVESTEMFLNLLNYIDDNWDKIYDEIGKADQETSDFLHELELIDLDDDKGSRIARTIKEIRIRRRELKDQQELIRHLKTFLENNKSLKMSLFKVLQQMKKTIEYQETRYYSPRVRIDLECANINNSNENVIDEETVEQIEEQVLLDGINNIPDEEETQSTNDVDVSKLLEEIRGSSEPLSFRTN